MTSPSLYLHLPFCVRKCAYCDFVSFVPGAGEVAGYLEALRQDVARRAGEVAGQTADTVYLGGGTPTVCPAAELARVLETVSEGLSLAAGAEVTCEANPGTVDEASLRALREAGVNRLSLGVQSLREEELRLLGRAHTAHQAREAVGAARAAGFDNLSLDLIAGLPGQTVEQWEESLQEALALRPEHISCYGLSIPVETPLGERVSRGELAPLEEEAAAEIWLRTQEMLTGAGYEHYEVSNYARPGRQCRHNLNYWRNGEYLGCGVSAASYRGGRREVNVADPAEYLGRIEAGESPVGESETLAPDARLGETIMLGLRLAEGVSPAELRERFGEEPVARREPLAAEMRAAGLLEPEGERWRPTVRGMLLNNLLGAAFLGGE